MPEGIKYSADKSPRFYRNSSHAEASSINR
jgi:hypothetical protein